MPDHVRILDVRVDFISKQKLHEAIAGYIRGDAHEYLANVNVHAINLAQLDAPFRDILNRSPIVYCDGEGVRLGARVLGVMLPPRIVLTYWVWELCAFAAANGFSMFFLGGSHGAAEDAAAALRKKCPGLNIVGTHHGYFSKTGEESDRVVQLIDEARPNILFVCFGMPLQEHWVADNFARLRANVILFGGSTIEYTAGRKKLAPSWMSAHGMEWLYRLFQEPRRLWYRYLVGNPLFMVKVLAQRFREGTQS